MASPTPSEELGLLLEVAREPFGIAEPADHQWYREHPGASPTGDLVDALVQQGYLTYFDMPRPEEAIEGWIYAEITAAGRARIEELQTQGVEPESFSLDEEGNLVDDDAA